MSAVSGEVKLSELVAELENAEVTCSPDVAVTISLVKEVVVSDPLVTVTGISVEEVSGAAVVVVVESVWVVCVSPVVCSSVKVDVASTNMVVFSVLAVDSCIETVLN